MKFPILIHLLNNTANHIVQSVHDLPRGAYFKIVSGQFSDAQTLEDVEFRRIEPETNKEVVIINEPTQEDIGSSEPDSSDSGTSSSSEDSSSAGL